MGTKYRGTAEERRALDALIKLTRCTESVLERALAPIAKSRLTTSQFGVLEALHHLGPLCQREIGEKLLRSAGNISLVVRNLESRGLVERRRGTADRRFIEVHLTTAGRRLLETLFPRHVEATVEGFRALSPDEIAELSSLCRKLGLANQREGAASR